MSRGNFAAAMRKFQLKSAFNLAQIRMGSLQLVLRSIQYGSSITGAPGQPVREGDLLASWVLAIQSETRARIFTMSPYAESNEDGIARPGGGPYIQRSSVGGRWSVRKTIDGWPLIVDYVASQVANGGGFGR